MKDTIRTEISKAIEIFNAIHADDALLDKVAGFAQTIVDALNAGNKVLIDRRLRLQPATIPVALYPDWLRVLTEVDRAEKQSLPLKKRAAGPAR